MMSRSSRKGTSYIRLFALWRRLWADDARGADAKEDRMSRLIDTFLEMVRIDSESGDETAFLEHLERVFSRELDADCRFDDYGNLVAKVPPVASDVTAPVLFGVHGDTVRPGRGIEPVIEDGVIRSRGETVLGADDKAGIAEVVEAIRTAARRPPIDLVVTREEELGTRGARHLDTGLLRAEIGFVVDMDALNAVVIGGPSKMSIDVEIIGRAAHAGMEPEKGISAVRVAAAAVTILEEGWIDPQTTVNVGRFRGGEIRNGVPERAFVELECRSLCHESCLRQEKLIRRVFETAAAVQGARVEITSELSYRASNVPEGARTVRLASAAIRACGLEPEVRMISGGTDASTYNANGIETVVLGAGMKNEHTTDEEISLAAMETAVRILRHLIEALAG
jgi:tripeptide aminopeptidase